MINAKSYNDALSNTKLCTANIFNAKSSNAAFAKLCRTNMINTKLSNVALSNAKS